MPAANRPPARGTASWDRWCEQLLQQHHVDIQRLWKSTPQVSDPQAGTPYTGTISPTYFSEPSSLSSLSHSSRSSQSSHSSGSSSRSSSRSSSMSSSTTSSSSLSSASSSASSTSSGSSSSSRSSNSSGSSSSSGSLLGPDDCQNTLAHYCLFRWTVSGGGGWILILNACNGCSFPSSGDYCNYPTSIGTFNDESTQTPCNCVGTVRSSPCI
jgi:hypothetical protein